jgi:GNAT superfamily N-acetyltransferase
MPDKLVGKLVILEADPATPEVASLVALLDADLLERYPGMPIQGIDPSQFRGSGGVFLIGRVDGIPVACGALRPMHDGTGDVKVKCASRFAAELKRMFVRKDHRGRGFAKAILAALEEIAARRGYQTIRLETGIHQPEAIALYENAGYRPIPCFGESVDYHSRCFEKRLD